MKINIISNAVCAVALMFSLTSFTSKKKENNDSISCPKNLSMKAAVFQVRNSSKIKLAVSKDAGLRLAVVLKDQTGKMYYSETYGKRELQYRRTFDLDDLNDGTYFFELTCGDQKLSKEIEIHTNSQRLISIE